MNPVREQAARQTDGTARTNSRDLAGFIALRASACAVAVECWPEGPPQTRPL